MNTKHKQYIPYILAFLLITAVCGLVYVEACYVLRQSANDPQTELAENSALSLESVTEINVGTSTVDISKSLSPYIIIVDKDKKLLASTARIGEESPTPPGEIFDKAKEQGSNRATWEPKPGVRQALVAIPVQGKDQFVAVGRSLREVEKRQIYTLQMAGGAWLIMLLIAVVGIYNFQTEPKPKPIDEPPVV